MTPVYDFPAYGTFTSGWLSVLGSDEYIELWGADDAFVNILPLKPLNTGPYGNAELGWANGIAWVWPEKYLVNHVSDCSAYIKIYSWYCSKCWNSGSVLSNDPEMGRIMCLEAHEFASDGCPYGIAIKGGEE